MIFRLLALLLMVPVIYLVALLCGIGLWITDLRHVGQLMCSASELVVWGFREACSPGKHVKPSQKHLPRYACTLQRG